MIFMARKVIQTETKCSALPVHAAWVFLGSDDISSWFLRARSRVDVWLELLTASTTRLLLRFPPARGMTIFLPTTHSPWLPPGAPSCHKTAPASHTLGPLPTPQLSQPATWQTLYLVYQSYCHMQKTHSVSFLKLTFSQSLFPWAQDLYSTWIVFLLQEIAACMRKVFDC